MAAVRIVSSRGRFGTAMQLCRLSSSGRIPPILTASHKPVFLHPYWYDRRELSRSYSTTVKPWQWLKRRLYVLLAVAGISGGALIYVSQCCALIRLAHGCWQTYIASSCKYISNTVVTGIDELLNCFQYG